MSILSCNNLCMEYDGKDVIKNLSFSIEEGDYLCIIGENGAGKSTLMKGLLGLKKSAAGEILRADCLRDGRFGYIAQRTNVQRDFPASVFEIVLSGCLNKHRGISFYNNADKAKAWESLKKLGIESLASRCYRELSGGQQQRTLLARALCATEHILFMDEPTAGLDPMATTDTEQIVSELNKNGVTIVMISHDINSALNYASHILQITHQGYFFGTVSEYKESGAWQKAMRGEADV